MSTIRQVGIRHSRTTRAWIAALVVAAVGFGGSLVGMKRLMADGDRFWIDSQSEGIRYVQMLSLLSTMAGLASESKEGGWSVQPSPDGYIVSRGDRTRLAPVVPFPDWLKNDMPLPELRIGQSGSPEITLETDGRSMSICGLMLKNATWEMPDISAFEMGTVGMEGTWRWQRVDRNLIYPQADAVCSNPDYRDAKKLWFRVVTD